ncbi:MAG: hypothetical protein QHH30_02080 [candidate division NC10 bacterium]|nr:hypothetical protein [candidate division NC10 bacterium]
MAAALCGCATKIAGKKQLVPHPLYAQMGNQLQDGFLVCDSEGLTVGARYLSEAELLELLRSRTNSPSLFNPPLPWLEAMTPFLVRATNRSEFPVILEGQYAFLSDEKGSELYSRDYADLYQMLAAEKKGEQMVKVLGGLLFSFAPLVPGGSREGLLLFGSLDPKAKKAGLKLSFLFGGKPLRSQQCLFPFAVEPVASEKKD